MKEYVKEFIRRGLAFCWGGPAVIAVVYGILGATGEVEYLLPFEVMKSILTVTLLAFTAAGVTVVYQIERLPLFPAVLIHGVVLYLDYLLVYLFNGWVANVGVFTAVFAASYAFIWLIIWLVTRSSTRRLNRKLQ